MLISYAQNFEDVILHRALKHIDKGFYVDVGAQDEALDSVTRGFYERGWRGVHVEPVPEYAQALREKREGDIVLQVAIAATRGRLGFFAIPGTGISTGDMAIAQMHRSAGHEVSLIEVDSVPLGDVLDEYGQRDIHWLKIDVEGMEAQVIKSWDPSSVRPWIVVVESTRPGTPEPNHEEWEPGLLAMGYSYVYFDGLNRFYVSNDHPELTAAFGIGPNCFDNFALAPQNRLSALTAGLLNEANVQVEAGQAQISHLKGQLAERDADVARLMEVAAKSRREAAEALSAVKRDLMLTRMSLINAQKDLDAKTAQAEQHKGAIAIEQARALREFERANISAGCSTRWPLRPTTRSFGSTRSRAAQAGG